MLRTLAIMQTSYLIAVYLAHSLISSPPATLASTVPCCQWPAGRTIICKRPGKVTPAAHMHSLPVDRPPRRLLSSHI